MKQFALGALYGAITGDAYGGQVEFIKRWPIPQELMNMAEDMQGGGFLDLKQGQCTDDGELTICLLRSIVSEGPKRDPIYYYKKWLKSSPIDCGQTCASAFKGERLCTDSQANGALMRVSPIGVVGALLQKDIEDIANDARRDALCSHPHLVCQDANAIYSVAIYTLMANHMLPTTKRAKMAIDAASRLGQNALVKDWITDPDPFETVRLKMDRDNMGWLRWGLMLAFGHLRSCSKYDVAIRETVRMGGDTDTNACIVGGIMGALHGVDAIPKDWLNKVKLCKERPVWLQPSCIEKLLSKQI